MELIMTNLLKERTMLNKNQNAETDVIMTAITHLNGHVYCAELLTKNSKGIEVPIRQYLKTFPRDVHTVNDNRYIVTKALLSTRLCIESEVIMDKDDFIRDMSILLRSVSRNVVSITYKCKGRS